MKNAITQLLSHHQRDLEKAIQDLSGDIEASVKAMVGCLEGGGKILMAGNGGSAADAQHFAAELVGRFLKERPSLPGLALTTDTSALTAIGNDYGFDSVFSRQIEGLAGPGDLVFLISTSGNSPNLLKAAQAARACQCRSIGLLGRDGGKLAELVDVPLIVPSSSTPRIQEAHLFLIHVLCELLEDALFPLTV